MILQFLLAPAWLRRLDHYLLVKHPLLWASRMHYLVFYSLNSALLLALLFLLVPVSLDNLFLPKTMLSAVIVLGVVAALGWMHWRSLYDGKKQFVGTGRRGDSWRLLINMACLLLITANVLWARVLLNYRIACQLSPEELVADVNAMNRGITYICNDDGPGCSFPIHGPCQGHEANCLGDCKKQDYTFMQFDLVEEHLSEELKKQLLNEQQLAALAWQPLSMKEQDKYRAAYYKLVNKYEKYWNAVVWMRDRSDNNSRKFEGISERSLLKSEIDTEWLGAEDWARSTIYRISYTQAHPFGLGRGLLTEAFLLVVFASVFLLIYQHVGLRSFLISIAVFLLLNTIFVVSLRTAVRSVEFEMAELIGEKSEFLFFLYNLGIILLLFGFAQRISRAARYSRLKEIALACSNVFAPWLLLLCVSLIPGLHMPTCILLPAGILLFMLAFQPWLSRRYQKNKSLPL